MASAAYLDRIRSTYVFATNRETSFAFLADAIPEEAFDTILWATEYSPPEIREQALGWLANHYVSRISIDALLKREAVIARFHPAGALPILESVPSATLRAMPYEEYLQTAHWRSIRDAALERAEGRCQICNGDTNLDVHHRTYERRGSERNADVVVLCRQCHALFHGKLP